MEVAPVSVVIVNYNRRELLLECVESVLGQTVAPVQVIVVDNGSQDGSGDAVAVRFGDAVTLVRLEKNTGFAGGNNAGAALARGEWLAFLNNDATAEPSWLLQMLKAAAWDPAAGLLACRVLRGDTGLLDNVGVGLWPDGMSRGAHHFEEDENVVLPEVFIPSGCAMMVRRDAFESAGGFDESFFAYSEDTDLGIKLRLLGCTCVLADLARVRHRPDGGTLGMVGARKVFLVERNRIRVLVRYYPLSLVLTSPLYTMLRYLGLLAPALRAAAARGKEGKRASGPGSLPLFFVRGALALAGAYLSALMHLPRDLEVRREWKGKSRVGPHAVAGWVKKHRLSWRSMITLEEP